MNRYRYTFDHVDPETGELLDRFPVTIKGTNSNGSSSAPAWYTIREGRLAGKVAVLRDAWQTGKVDRPGFAIYEIHQASALFASPTAFSDLLAKIREHSTHGTKTSTAPAEQLALI